MADECPVCSCELNSDPTDDSKVQAKHYDCPNCGKFAVSLDAQLTMFPLTRPAVVSHVIWKRQAGGQECRLDPKTINGILETETLPTPVEGGERAILYLGAETKENPGRFQEAKPAHLQAKFGANDASDVLYILENLRDRSLLELRGDSTLAICRLTFAGWEKYEELMRGRTESRRAFMAMPFRDEKLDKVFMRFKQAVKDTGFELKRVDMPPRPGLIDDHLRVDLGMARFVVAELTNENPGVYWEAGYAEGLGKPVIYSCEKSYFEGKKTHFDTNHHLTIRWEENNLDAAAEELKATIRAALPADAKMSDEDQS